MDRIGRHPDSTSTLYASYVVRVWRPRAGELPTRVDIEHVQTGHRLAADADAYADLVARLAAPFPTGPDPPRDADRLTDHDAT